MEPQHGNKQGKRIKLNKCEKKHHHKGPKGVNMNHLAKEISKKRAESIEEYPQERQRHIEAYFLGPRGENADFFSNLIQKSINAHITARTSMEASDPRHITREMKIEPSFLAAQDRLEKELNEVLTKLRDLSSPFYSSRYYGHMNWQVTIPGIVGNFAALLYNQNNCAFEGAPYTTMLEIESMKHFADVFEYPPMLSDEGEEPFSWGHFTCGGTVANIEAQWAARNCRFLMLSLRRYTQYKGQGQNILVNLVDKTQKELGKLTAWELLNIDNDETMDLYNRLFKQIYGQNTDKYSEYQNQVAEYSIGKAGEIKMYDWLREIRAEENATYWPNGVIPSPVLLCSATKHYSIPKGLSLLGFGENNAQKIEVDKDSRMSTEKLRAKLNSLLESKTPVLVVAAIVGTTEESVVDNLVDIYNLKNQFAAKGLYFHFHIDAAYGAYFCSMLRKKTEKVWFDSISDYVRNQLEVFHHADSITFDPHKTGYVPYTCGGIIYKNHRLRDNLSFSAPYIYTGAEPNVAIYGIEGSKPGSSVVSVYLSLCVLPLIRAGHGELLERTMMNTKIFCASLYQLEKYPIHYDYVDSNGVEKSLTETFYCYQLPRTYIEKTGKGDLATQNAAYEAIAKTSPLDMEDVVKSNGYEEYYKELGPDMNIPCYVINFNTSGTTKNTSLKALNEYTKKIVETSKPVGTDKSVRLKDLYVSETEISRSSYGATLFDDFLARHGLVNDYEEEAKIVFIRSTIMNAFFTELKGHDTTESSNDIFLEEISEAACEALLLLGKR